ncbi:rod shape-determining protein MreD [Candidatus Puniceispirillum sp.]|nr:rod shape-determining protein MreD [Candidatus Puniceispirillum sp.]
MKDQRSYFEKADFHSDFPLQFLAAAFGLMLVLIELGLAHWPIFHGAAPNLSLVFIYYVMIYHSKLLPIFSIFLIGIFGDFLFSDLLGGRASALMLLAYVIQYRISRLQQSDFGELWLDFSISFTLISLFQLVLFMLINMAIPSLNPILFQIGVTLLLLPFGFLMMFAFHSLLQKMKVV